MLEWGLLNLKIIKKNFFGHFAVCRGHSTRQSDRMGRPGTRLCRVPKVGHTANLFAVCIYRHTAKKSGQTPSRPVDGVGGCSPCARTAGTRQRSPIRRVPGRQAHGKAPRFAVCPDGRHTAKLPDSPCARPRHTANLVSRAGHMVTLPCA